MEIHKILLVDDDETWLKILRAAYTQDYEVVTATDGLQALEILQQEKIDLVISDVLMPNMDGYHLSYKIRTNDKLKDIPIIIYSALTVAEKEENVAREMGANLYIRKPASIEVLTNAVKEIFAKPEKYPSKIPLQQESDQLMRQFSKKLVADLEQSNVELEEIKTKLEYSESRLKQAQGIAGLGNWEFDFTTKIALWSDEACRLYGLPTEENRQPLDAFLSFVHPDDLSFVTKIVTASRDSLLDTSFYHRIIRKDGEIRYIYTQRWYEWDTHGKPKGLYGISRDITASRNSEERIKKISDLYLFIGQINQNIVRIKKEEDLFRNACRIACQYGKFKIAWVGVVNPADNSINLVDETGIPEKYSGLFTNIPSRPNGPQDHVLRTGTHYVSNDIENDSGLENWKTLAIELAIRSCMWLAIKKSGNVIGTLNLYSTDKDFFDKEKIALLQEVTSDISFALDTFENAKRQKEAEALVAEGKKHLEFDKNNLNALINNTGDFLWSLNRDFKLITFNQPFEQVVRLSSGKQPEKGVNILSFSFSQEQSVRYKSFYERAFAGEAFTEIEYTNSPVEFWSEISFYPIREGDKVIGSACHSRNLTAIKLAERELMSINNRLLFHLENSPLGFIEWDAQLRVKAWSKRAEEIFGWSEEECIHQHRNGYKGVFEEDLPWVSKIAHQLLSGKIKRNSIQHRNYAKDGRVIWCEWFNSVKMDKAGKVETLMSLVLDITKRKESEDEIKELNEHLEERVQERTMELTEANKALEAFSYSVSHDLRAPVRAVRSFTKIIHDMHSAKMNPELTELFGYIEDSSKRMSNIINDLLLLAKYGKEKLKFGPVKMMDLINGVWLTFSRTTPHHAVLELAELPVIQADQSMMEQVVINLISNAVKYSSKREKPVVTIWSEQTKENITFYFKDNGAGFDMKNYDRLFGAFQRLHGSNEFEGVGVGLTLVKRIIEKHGGVVGAEGKVGEGATFYFTLPLL